MGGSKKHRHLPKIHLCNSPVFSIVPPVESWGLFAPLESEE